MGGEEEGGGAPCEHFYLSPLQWGASHWSPGHRKEAQEATQSHGCSAPMPAQEACSSLQIFSSYRDTAVSPGKVRRGVSSGKGGHVVGKLSSLM